MSNFSLIIDDVTLENVAPDASVAELCDLHSAPLSFMCRGASCGTCAVRVLDGHDNLSAQGEDELTLLEMMFGSPPDVRLACQLRVRGPAQLEPYDK